MMISEIPASASLCARDSVPLPRPSDGQVRTQIRILGWRQNTSATINRIKAVNQNRINTANRSPRALCFVLGLTVLLDAVHALTGVMTDHNATTGVLVNT